MPTWNIIGHQPAIDALARAVADNKPSHAYLFSGTRHLGKTTVARLFAGALLCGQAEAPCGTCGACQLYGAGNHPDYFELPREEKLTIAQVRKLRADLSLKPHSAPWRVGVIPEADRLGIPAQNALLKLLEEPPAHTVLILTAPSPASLLPTTVSRCQQLRFTVPAADELRAALQDKGAQTDEAIRAAGRRPGLALSLLDDETALADRGAWRKTLIEVTAAAVPQRLKLAKELANDEHLTHVLDQWISVHHDALHGELEEESGGLSDEAVELARLYSEAQLVANLQRLVATRQRLAYNPNVLLLVEDLLLNIGE